MSPSPNGYTVLKQQVFEKGPYSIVPIRYEDRFRIMKWRNEQMYHLRQNKVLTVEDQNIYFDTVVNPGFTEERPNQILFSYLYGNECIGYGGLVHINWVDKHAEISFIMDTDLEKEHFHYHWQNYLGLIDQVAFKDLKLHKAYVYAFDLRPHLYIALEDFGYFQDARLKDHCFFDGSHKDVVIHSKLIGQ